MPRLIVRASLLATLLVTAACTQQAAQVDLKGQNTYGRNGEFAGNYASNGGASYQPAPVYTNTAPQPAYGAHNIPQATEQSATVQSIGMSDLPPPSRTDNKPYSEREKDFSRQQASAASSQSVNLWTNRPRASESAEVKLSSDSSQDKTVAQLDKVIDNDGSSKQPTAVSAKSATKTASSGFMWPVDSRKVISGFGPKGGGKVNDGINIASSEGEPVWAAADGEVVYAGNELQGYGNMVLIKHAGNKTTSYAHLNRATVDKYDRVKQGDIIGYVGSTGNVKAPQLHFAIRDGKEPVDPEKYLNRNVANL